ncbi:MAG: SGNH/GDSL hydrolase family protein [Bacteroidota bacterium]
MRKYVLIFLLLFSSLISNSQEKPTNVAPDEQLSILFIGNSLTYANNLPALVKKEAKKRGVKIYTEMVAFANYAIEDHWNDGNVQKLIASKKYQYVILQQGPSSQTPGRNMLIESGKQFSALCAANETKLCYFMVWPALKYYQTFDGVIQNYSDAASINNALLLPVGQYWKRYFDRTKDFSYYSPDRFHPSAKGSRVAAEIIVDHLMKDFMN